ncbi:hypothetical protein M422DRAFT_50439 [Sphaerobolus stellatus SS14]|uniref:Uncharacterized protein n=1 Tax=Sphaerobolus stellatus (strain SS14) TaxID=990650 RepID=A0A0C9URF3_SPHS4|nr:hypothetical protein M422DRAFT_50439 [Sphaerobolus stellatus SS14]
MTDILDPSALLSRLPSLISQGGTLKSPQDGLVALVHTAMVALSFRLVGLDDLGTVNSYENNVLPETWNAHGPGNYTLRYKHEQSSLEFILKISKLGTRTVINAIAAESDKTATLDVQTGDYTSNSFYPYTPGQSDAQPVVHGFISSNRVKDFIDAFKLNIVQKLVPGLRKEGYSESAEEYVSLSSHTVLAYYLGNRSIPPRAGQRQAPPPQAPRQPAQPAVPSPLFGGQQGGYIPGRNPLEIGRQDLDPIPLHPNPFAPGGFGGPSRGDGMFVGPNHPIFSDRFAPGRGGGLGGNGGQGPWGGDGFLPPMGAPPGARFDPIGPIRSPFGGGGGGGGGGGIGGPSFPRGPGGPGGMGRAPPRSGEPDNDEFLPPGMVSD